MPDGGGGRGGNTEGQRQAMKSNRTFEELAVLEFAK
jgi:hypothetical protein